MRFKILFYSYLLVIIGLFFYSFTQIDLGLTLTQWSIWQVFQAFFQQIGYFNRPLSTFFYITLIILLYVFYLIFLALVNKNKITKKQLWRVIIVTSVIFFFSYNAFSHDLFNYVFDAKIVTYYQQNPYEHKALDYPGEPMLSFMHWTHRVYPYGPVWLLLTIPLSFLGFGYFLFTLMLFKALMFVSFLASVFFIGKIMQKISPGKELFSIAFFALNPLVIIESLVSSHHDIVMMALALCALSLAIEKKYVRSLIILILSIGLKFATVFLVPIFGFIFIVHKKGWKINWEKLFIVSSALMVLSIIFASFRTQLQPWYLLWVLPFISFIPTQKWAIVTSIVISFGLLLHYAPYLYLGNWDPPVPTVLSWITVISLAGSFILNLLLKNDTISKS